MSGHDDSRSFSLYRPSSRLSHPILSASSINLKKKKGEIPGTLDSTDAFLAPGRYDEVVKGHHEFNPNPHSELTPQMVRNMRDQRKVNKTDEGFRGEPVRIEDRY